MRNFTTASKAYLVRQVEPYIEDIRQWMEDCRGWTFTIQVQKIEVVSATYEDLEELQNAERP